MITKFNWLVALLLLGTTPQIALAQNNCNYPAQAYASFTPGSKINLQNTGDFLVDYSPDPNFPAYLPECASLEQNATFRLNSLGNNHVRGTWATRYYLEFYRQDYDCSSGSLGQLTLVHTTATYDSYDEFIVQDFIIPVSELGRYRVRMFRKHRNIFNNWVSNWSTEWTNSITIGPGQADTEAQAVFTNATGTVTVNTNPWGAIQMPTFCLGQDIIVDASATSCENNWSLKVYDLDPLTWSTGQLLGQTGNISGQAPANIDVTSLVPASELEHGRHYMVIFVAGPSWSPVYLQFTYEDVNLSASIVGYYDSYQKYAAGKGGMGFWTSVYRQCHNRSLFLNGTPTTCYENWTVRAVQVNSTSLAEIGGTEWSQTFTGPISTQNMSSLYGNFTIGNFYKVEFIATSPLTRKPFYIEVVQCDANGFPYANGLAGDGGNGIDIGNGDMVADIYPNPSSDVFNVYFSSEAETLDYQVLDLTGRVVASESNVRPGNFKIDLTDQPTGIYLLNVVSGQETMTQKLIKQ